MAQNGPAHSPQERLHIFFPILLLVFCLLLFALLLLAATPPICRDGLIHHLQIPKLYLQHGGIYEIPDLVFSYYPMNLDLLYMGALALGSDILPKYIHMAFGLATAWLLFAYLKKRLSTAYALLGALFFLSIPIIVKLSITVYVDLGLIFFTTASILLLFRWMDNGYNFRYLISAGICCGLALGTKYNGLVVLLLLTLFVPVLRIRSAPEKQGSATGAISSLLLFACCALLAASPWLIRNAIWTGNPIYPLYNSLFNAESIAAAEEDASTIRGVFATRHALYGENIWQLLALPVRIFFEGVDDDPRYFDGRLNPFLLILPLLAIAGWRGQDRRTRLENATWLAFSILYFLFAFNTGVLRIRYLTPMLPSLVVLSMHGLHTLELLAARYDARRLLAAWFLGTPVFLMLAVNGWYVLQQFQHVQPISYLTGAINREEYITRFRPEYPVIEYANEHLPASATILCLFLGHRGYHLERSHYFDQHGEKNWLLAWLQEPDITIEEILNRLRHRGITHLLLRVDLLNNWIQQTLAGKDKMALLQDLFEQHSRKVMAHKEYVLLQLTPK